MRKAFSIILELVAGFFFYSAFLVIFVGGLPIAGVFGLFAVFAIPGLAALLGGLALARFRHWKRDAGIVIISSSALFLSVLISVASIFATSAFREMATPASMQFLKNYHYVAGSIGMATLTALGGMLIVISKMEAARPDKAVGSIDAA